MKFEYTLQISGVDGETFFTFLSPNTAQVKTFLELYDHEGSNIFLTIKAYDENVNKILDLIRKEEE